MNRNNRPDQGQRPGDRFEPIEPSGSTQPVEGSEPIQDTIEGSFTGKQEDATFGDDAVNNPNIINR